ncbi:MAG TPA: hypothetical protein VK963_03720 [Candidatus Saccharimonadales bacterium]|nr:hypothetical protein [Candidatus Saccharimonadales bacterium]
MNSTQKPSSKLDNSNGGKKYDKSTKPTAPRVLPKAPAPDTGHSSNKGGLGKSLAEKDDQPSRQPKSKPSRKKAPHSKVAGSSPKKKPDFQTLLQRCYEGASQVKGAEAENTKATIVLLCQIPSQEPERSIA